jgi:hypothetical protein
MKFKFIKLSELLELIAKRVNIPLFKTTTEATNYIHLDTYKS